MIVTRTAIVLGMIAYAALWMIVIAGATAFLPLVVVITVLVLLVAGGNLLQSFMGIPGRPQKFKTPDDEDDTTE